MNKTNVPKIPGYITYLTTVGDNISITLKPIDQHGPMATLDEKGRWINTLNKTFYKIDKTGARWKHTVSKKVTDLTAYYPSDSDFVHDNELAHKIDSANWKKERKKEKIVAEKKKAVNEKKHLRRKTKRQSSRKTH